MLSSISWQHYLAAIVILSVSYYGYVILRYYQQEISNLFNRKQNNANLFPNASAAPANVMGAAKLDVGVSLTKSEEMHFTDSSPDEVEPNSSTNVTPISNQALSYSPSEELETEAGNLIKAFEEINNKPEFITLIRILINSYKRFQDEIDLPATLNKIVEISKERLMFPLTLTDLQETCA
jgi:hypothetical protein